VSGVQGLRAAFIGATSRNQLARPALTQTAAATVNQTAGRRRRTIRTRSQVSAIASTSIAAPTTPKAT
jgi:hypothetical protein